MAGPAVAAGGIGLGEAILGASGVLGGLFGGLAGSDAAKTGVREQAKQFRINEAQQLLAQLEAGPLRDRILFNLLARLGMPTSQFASRRQPGDVSSMGGIDQNALNQRLGEYTPGAGGVDPSLRELLLEQIGYGKLPEGGYVQANDPRFKASGASKLPQPAPSTPGAGTPLSLRPKFGVRRRGF